MGSGVLLPRAGQPTTGPEPSFKSGAIPNIVSFLFEKVAPPAGAYIQRDDVVLFQAVSQTPGETVTLLMRMLLPFAQAPGQPDKPPPSGISGGNIVGPGYVQTIALTLQLPAALTNVFKTIVLTEGYLLSAAVVCSVAPRIGLTYARAQLNRGSATSVPGNPFMTLLGGYVTLLQPIGWPAGVYIRNADGPGLLQGYAVANPAAGADFVFSTAAVGRARLAGAVATLTTSAAAGNRVPSFRLTETTIGTNQYQVQDTVAVPASTTVTYSLAPNGTIVRGAGAPIFVTLPIPEPFMATAAVNVQSSTQGLLAGDQWSAINIYTEEWLEIF